jgi:hypothetical protein
MNSTTFKDEIPEDVLSLIIKPLINQNPKTFDEFLSHIQKESKINQENRYFSLLRKNFQWLLNPSSKSFIKRMLNSEMYYINFKKLVIIICENAIKSILFLDIINQVNDLLTEYKYAELDVYNIKLYIPNTSSKKVNDYIAFSLHDYFKDNRNRISGFWFERYSHTEEELEGQHILYKFSLGFKDKGNKSFKDKYQITFFLTRNIDSLINYQSIYIRFHLSNDLNSLLDEIPEDIIDFFIDLLKNYPYISNIKFKFCYNLPDSILKFVDILNSEYSEFTSFYSQPIFIDKILATKYQNDYFNLNFKQFNIFIGKNNSGKTYTLREIYSKPDKLQFHNLDKINIYGTKHFRSASRSFPLKELYFIPKLRSLKDSAGTYENIYPRLRRFYEEINHLRNFKFEINNLTWDSKKY